MTKIEVCPECDSPSLHFGSTIDRWLCETCGHKFDEPATRNRKHNHDTRKGLAKKLADMDPETDLT